MVVYLIGDLIVLSKYDFDLQYFKIVPPNSVGEVVVMESFWDLTFSRYSCKVVRIVLALFWIGGLTSGILFGMYAVNFLPPINHIDIGANESECLLVLSFRLLPLFFCFLSFYTLKPTILFLVVFTKAFFFSLSAAISYFIVGTSAWMISFFVFMGDAIVLSSCWFVLYRSLRYGFPKCTVWILLAVIVSITLFDYLCIAPFLAKLI